MAKEEPHTCPQVWRLSPGAGSRCAGHLVFFRPLALSTLGWPKQTEELKYFYPTSTLVTGYDIIFFWVARMIFSGVENTGKSPF